MMFWGGHQKDIDDLKRLAIIQGARIQRLEMAVDKLAEVVGLEWRNEDKAWKPKEKEDNG